MKTCTKCKELKELKEFHKDKKNKDGLCYKCKSCFKKYREKNKEKLKEKRKEYREKNKEKIKKKAKVYRENNKEKLIQYRQNNKEKLNEYHKEWFQNNKEKINEYYKIKKQANSLFKLRCNIASLICSCFKKQGYTKQSKTYKILGCTYEEFKIHLENQFTDGMTWENQGEWHLDHIYPVSLAKDEEELIKLNHYTNFQPLWAEDNLKKSNKII